MNAGIGLLLGCLAVVGFLWGSQLVMSRLARRNEGQPVPGVDGPMREKLDGDVLVWFHSKSCGPCRAMEPGVRQLAAEGRAEIVDVHENLPLAQAFGVMATPTTVHVKGGRIEAVRTGMLRPEELRALLAG
ncbi:MAG: thioredoxin family protein [Myxococcales bacterium]|nr:thioredoxin family protein [Myxococcales bacterium]